MQNFLLQTKITRVKNAEVAAATDITDATIIDMEGFTSVTFVALFGTLTANQVTSLTVEGGNVSDGSDFVLLSGATAGVLADDDDNQCLLLEVDKPPTMRYLRVRVERATANAVLDGIIAIQSGAKKCPTSHDATTVSEAVLAVSPRAVTTGYTATEETFSGSTTKIVQTARTSS